MYFKEDERGLLEDETQRLRDEQLVGRNVLSSSQRHVGSGLTPHAVASRAQAGARLDATLRNAPMPLAGDGGLDTAPAPAEGEIKRPARPKPKPRHAPHPPSAPAPRDAFERDLLNK